MYFVYLRSVEGRKLRLDHVLIIDIVEIKLKSLDDDW